MSEQTWVYHISPSPNTDSILLRGVHPAYSRGKRKVSWWVEVELLDWALAHISARWHTSVDHLTVFASVQDLRTMRRWSKSGVYTCDKPVMVTEFRNALDAMASQHDGEPEDAV